MAVCVGRCVCVWRGGVLMSLGEFCHISLSLSLPPLRQASGVQPNLTAGHLIHGSTLSLSHWYPQPIVCPTQAMKEEQQYRILLPSLLCFVSSSTVTPSPVYTTRPLVTHQRCALTMRDISISALCFASFLQ